MWDECAGGRVCTIAKVPRWGVGKVKKCLFPVHLLPLLVFLRVFDYTGLLFVILADLLWLVAMTYYLYITFLGYSSQCLHTHTHTHTRARVPAHTHTHTHTHTQHSIHTHTHSTAYTHTHTHTQHSIHEL